MPYTPTKVKCPKCGKLIPKRILLLTNGKCNNCGYQIASPMTIFFNGSSKEKTKKLE